MQWRGAGFALMDESWARIMGEPTSKNKVGPQQWAHPPWSDGTLRAGPTMDTSAGLLRQVMTPG